MPLIFVVVAAGCLALAQGSQGSQGSRWAGWRVERANNERDESPENKTKIATRLILSQGCCSCERSMRAMGGGGGQ